MAVKRNAGREIGPKPLLLDRARRARLVPVRRGPWHRRALKPSLVLAVIMGVGGVVAYRLVGSVDMTRLIQAAPTWMQGVLPGPATQSSGETTVPTAVVPRTEPLSRPPLKVPEFVRPPIVETKAPGPLKEAGNPPIPVMPPVVGPSGVSGDGLPSDTWSVLTTPAEVPTTKPASPEQP